MTQTTYQRPELTEADKKTATERAKKFFRQYGLAGIVPMLAVLFQENMLLVKEIQEHRAARGIEPLKTFEV